jgi:hypothetical protein
MRWSGFILGGIVGIAAAAYMSQKRPGSLAWAGNATGQLVTGMKGRILETALTRKFGNEMSAKPSAKHETKQSMGNAGKGEDSWKTIENILNSDPEVKAAANEILADTSASQSNAASAQASH